MFSRAEICRACRGMGEAYVVRESVRAGCKGGGSFHRLEACGQAYGVALEPSGPS